MKAGRTHQVEEAFRPRKLELFEPGEVEVCCSRDYYDKDTISVPRRLVTPSLHLVNGGMELNAYQVTRMMGG